MQKIVHDGDIVYFNENAYKINGANGKIYQLLRLTSKEGKIEITIKYRKKEKTINALNLTNIELFLICKMLNYFKDK
ncbi:MAG: hypothetical protein [Wendovervirus sonii]|uniref:Uncharacterized protein n=1 Tax=phage Lak_Megaphage_Sonny TaxID=3109229 RepID=A0ABZ0Z235_9CAUD|nr:MAG: hypothetical protein [phage Lak_Megaphage_Sonny]